jgi:ABC-type transporter Mla subunit MlaD
MATRANYVKLGLFVVLGLIVAVALGVIIGEVKLRRPTTHYVTYFDESVQGLEVGASVKARGVPVGRVDRVTFAPDHEEIEVGIEFDVATLESMGLRANQMRPDIRAQLASQGLISGAKFIALDIFDQKTHPPPPLRFTPPENYIPSTPSAEKNLEALAAKALDRVSVLADSLVQEGIAPKVSRGVDDLDGLMTDLDRAVQQIGGEKLPARASATL